MVRWGSCHRCGEEVKIAYIREQRDLIPIGLWCKGCGFEDKKIVISYSPGYIERRAYKIELKNGMIIKTEISIALNEVIDEV